MTPRRSSLVLAASAALLTSVLTVPGALSASAQPSAPTTPADPTPSATASTSDALAALRVVRSIFDGARHGGRGFAQDGTPVDPAAYDATLALRDLSLVKHRLSGPARDEAEGYFARPTDPEGPNNPDTAYSVPEAPPVCNTEVCVHYVATTNDAPPMTDGNGNGRPDYVDTTFSTVSSVHDQFVSAGYRSPKPDGTRGGSSATDVYIADIGDDGLYGYCTTDQNVPSQGPADAWAYCVVDDDYAANEFPTNTSIENLQVTVAHEFFHAVQFGYDFREDSWFLEGTAAWAEDEFFDNVDDNLQYLPQSPLRQPKVPLDTFGGSFHYGTWIFFRYLTERFPAAEGGLPVIVRDMWRQADSLAGAPDLYSMQAIKKVVRSKGKQFPELYAQFSNANRRPRATYSEGRANRYKSAPLVKRYRLGKGSARRGAVRLDHLTSATVRVTPAAALRGRTTWKLRVNLDMAKAARGSAALASIKLRNGKTRKVVFNIRDNGTSTRALPFSAKKIKYVELTLVNAGTQYRCFKGGPYSCRGFSRNDDTNEAFRLQVVGRGPKPEGRS